MVADVPPAPVLPPHSLLTLKAEDPLIWLPPHDPSLLHVWYGQTTTSSLSCRASQGSQSAGDSHRGSPDIRRWCVLSCMPRKLPGKDSAGSSPSSTGLWRKLMPHLVVPPCRCGCAVCMALWALTRGILVPWKSRKL